MRLLAATAVVALAAAVTAAGAGANQRTRLYDMVVETAAGYFHVSQSRLHAELGGGRSLAEVARARGRSVESLKQFLVRNVTLRLHELAPRGLTSRRYERLMGRLERRIERLVDRAQGERGGAGGMRSAAYAAAAGYLDLSSRGLTAELRGRSLAQLAGASGRSVDGLRRVMRAAAERRINVLAAGGHLSVERKHRLLSRLDRRVARMLVRVHNR